MTPLSIPTSILSKILSCYSINSRTCVLYQFGFRPKPLQKRREKEIEREVKRKKARRFIFQVGNSIHVVAVQYWWNIQLPKKPMNSTNARKRRKITTYIEHTLRRWAQYSIFIFRNRVASLVVAAAYAMNLFVRMNENSNPNETC